MVVKIVVLKKNEAVTLDFLGYFFLCRWLRLGHFHFSRFKFFKSSKTINVSRGKHKKSVVLKEFFTPVKSQELADHFGVKVIIDKKIYLPEVKEKKSRIREKLGEKSDREKP